MCFNTIHKCTYISIKTKREVSTICSFILTRIKSITWMTDFTNHLKISRPHIWKQIAFRRPQVPTKLTFSDILPCWPNPNLPDALTSGGGFTQVTTALSESSSIHSEALYNLTKDMPMIGLEPVTYSIMEAKPYIEELWAEEMQSLLQPVSFFFYIYLFLTSPFLKLFFCTYCFRSDTVLFANAFAPKMDTHRQRWKWNIIT